MEKILEKSGKSQGILSEGKSGNPENISQRPQNPFHTYITCNILIPLGVSNYVSTPFSSLI